MISPVGALSQEDVREDRGNAATSGHGLRADPLSIALVSDADRALAGGMRRNFVIFYTAREGSSAIVNQLSAQRDILVPAFEGLDRYAFKRRFPLTALPQAVETALSKGEFDEDFHARRRMLAERHEEQTIDRVGAVGFKWRPHGNPETMAEVFRRNNTTVFMLFRRDFAELVSSLVVSEHMKEVELGGHSVHHQFKYREASTEEKERIRSYAESVRIPLKRRAFLTTAAKRVVSAYRVVRYAERVARHGIPMHVIYYEDFLRDPERFLQDMKTTLDLAQPFERARGNEFEKITTIPATDRIVGLDEYLTSLPMRAVRAAYDRQLANATALTRAAESEGKAADGAVVQAVARPN